MNAIEIKKMSRIERLQIMESIWSSFLDEDVDVESPKWHKSILEKRKESLQSGKSSFISLEELRSNRNS